ncbi:uncharacterized protein LOC111035893 [Myzus persicae]|uniref:uncharacterized protein LOC111035893 n=1 Tax=Myzus persicae TaxID=13164 RepID=UPI000B93373A|nr:uncharacterized protein LOC111035893 [Myzus persicae]
MANKAGRKVLIAQEGIVESVTAAESSETDEYDQDEADDNVYPKPKLGEIKDHLNIVIKYVEDKYNENVSAHYENLRHLREVKEINVKERQPKISRFVKPISKGGSDLIYEIDTFFRLVGDKIYQIYWNCDEDEMRVGRMKLMSEENESCLAEIKSLNGEIENMVIDHKDKVQEYEIQKIKFDERVLKLYREAQLNKVRIERKNRNEMLINLMEREKELDDLEKINKENKRKFIASKEINIVETEQMKKELFRKEEFLKMFCNRFSKDMLMRYKKKKGLELSIKEKKTMVETLKENVTLMATHLADLQESERVYLKREVYDKLDAIRERIALRTITAFIMPYVNLKFKSRKKKIKSKKTKGLNKKPIK